MSADSPEAPYTEEEARTILAYLGSSGTTQHLAELLAMLVGGGGERIPVQVKADMNEVNHSRLTLTLAAEGPGGSTRLTLVLSHLAVEECAKALRETRRRQAAQQHQEQTPRCPSPNLPLTRSTP